MARGAAGLRALAEIASVVAATDATDAAARAGAVRSVTTTQLEEALAEARGAGASDAAAVGVGREGRADGPLVSQGMGVSPGRAVGVVCADVEAALEVLEAGRPVVLVVPATSPADELVLAQVAAVVTAGGGFADHAAVVARALGIPAVSGVIELAPILAEAAVLVDGDHGLVRAADPSTTIGIQGSAGTSGAAAGSTEGAASGGSAAEGAAARGSAAGAVETPLPEGVRTLLSWADEVAGARLAVWAAADSPDAVRAAVAAGARGIALVRLEHLLVGPLLKRYRDALAGGGPEVLAGLTDDLAECLEALFRAAERVPVMLRLIDAPSHEFLDDPAWRETDPSLGMRGVRVLLARPDLLDAQCRAVATALARVRAAGFDLGGPGAPITVLVPMVSDPAEVPPVRAALEAAAAAVGVESPLVGAMVETPRAALLAGALAHVVDHLAVGSNDLTMCTYGLGRSDAAARVVPALLAAGVWPADPFRRLDPHGVGRLVALAASEAQVRRPELRVSLCGEHAGDPGSIAVACRARVDVLGAPAARVAVARLAAAHAVLEG